MTTPARLRPIAPIELAGAPVSKPAGARPRLEWVAPAALLVDESYQRQLSKESYRLIRRMAGAFAWNRMKPPVAVPVGDALHVIDGQHTAIAAASIGLAEIPVFVVEAGDGKTRAAAFVGHNTDRLRVAPITVYQALLAAEDPDAQDVANVCRRAGVRVRNLNQASVVAVGDTMAIGTLRALIKRRGVRKARLVLETLVMGECAPISSAEIWAADKVLARAGAPPVEDLARVIAAAGEEGFLSARATASRAKRPIRDVLAERWLKSLERRGKA